MSVVTYHINAISYLDSQKWVTGSSNVVLWVKIAEKMALNEGNWVPWPVSSMKLLKQSDKTNASGMKTMERIANPGFIFTTKKIWRLLGWKYAHKKILKWRCHGDLQKLIISTIFVILRKNSYQTSNEWGFFSRISINMCHRALLLRFDQWGAFFIC